MQNKVEQVPEAPNHWSNSEACAWQSGYAAALGVMHNEHAALNAVAEAGELMLMRMKSETSRFPVAEKLKRSRFIERMESSLATLQSIRKGANV